MPSELSTGAISFSDVRSDEVQSLCAKNSSKLIKSAEDLARGIRYFDCYLELIACLTSAQMALLTPTTTGASRGSLDMISAVRYRLLPHRKAVLRPVPNTLRAHNLTTSHTPTHRISSPLSYTPLASLTASSLIGLLANRSI